jgi:hypothetical protein
MDGLIARRLDLVDHTDENVVVLTCRLQRRQIHHDRVRAKQQARFKRIENQLHPAR